MVFNSVAVCVILLLGLLVGREGFGDFCLARQLDLFVSEVSVSLFGNNTSGLGHRRTKCEKCVLKMEIKFLRRPHVSASWAAASASFVIR